MYHISWLRTVSNHIFQNLDICKLSLLTLISNSSYLAIQTLKTWPRHFSVLLNYSLNINRKAFIAAHSFRTLNFEVMRVRSDTFCDPLKKMDFQKWKLCPIDEAAKVCKKAYDDASVKDILKGSLDSIPSPSTSVKIQIMCGKVYLRE